MHGGVGREISCEKLTGERRWVRVVVRRGVVVVAVG